MYFSSRYIHFHPFWWQVIPDGGSIRHIVKYCNKNQVLDSMCLFDFLDKISQILAGFSPKLVILLQINQPLCKPGNVTMKIRRSTLFFVCISKGWYTYTVSSRRAPFTSLNSLTISCQPSSIIRNLGGAPPSRKLFYRDSIISKWQLSNEGGVFRKKIKMKGAANYIMNTCKSKINLILVYLWRPSSIPTGLTAL